MGFLLLIFISPCRLFHRVSWAVCFIIWGIFRDDKFPHMFTTWISFLLTFFISCFIIVIVTFQVRQYTLWSGRRWKVKNKNVKEEKVIQYTLCVCLVGGLSCKNFYSIWQLIVLQDGKFHKCFPSFSSHSDCKHTHTHTGSFTLFSFNDWILNLFSLLKIFSCLKRIRRSIN